MSFVHIFRAFDTRCIFQNEYLHHTCAWVMAYTMWADLILALNTYRSHTLTFVTAYFNPWHRSIYLMPGQRANPNPQGAMIQYLFQTTQDIAVFRLWPTLILSHECLGHRLPHPKAHFKHHHPLCPSYGLPYRQSIA